MAGERLPFATAGQTNAFASEPHLQTAFGYPPFGNLSFWHNVHGDKFFGRLVSYVTTSVPQDSVELPFSNFEDHCYLILGIEKLLLGQASIHLALAGMLRQDFLLREQKSRSHTSALLQHSDPTKKESCREYTTICLVSQAYQL